MKRTRMILLASVTALLLALPASASAWIYQVYTYNGSGFTPTTSNTTGLDFSRTFANAGSTSVASLTDKYNRPYFSILPEGSGAAVGTVTVNVAGTWAGTGAEWGGSYELEKVTNGGAVYGRSSSWKDASTDTSSYDLPLGSIYALNISNFAKAGSSNISINITATSPDAKTPIPGTLLLLGPGIAGLAALRRRFKKS